MTLTCPAPRRTSPTLPDERTLFSRWQTEGDTWARDVLVERYLPLARKLALRYARSSEPLDDLVQVACVGLVAALKRFDVDRAPSFTSFAVPTILGELRHHFRDAGWAVHVPRATQERVLQIERAQRELVGSRGRAPTVQELAQYTEMEPELVLDALQAAGVYDTLSLDAPRQGSDGEMQPLVEALGERDARFEFVEDRSAVAAGMQILSDREREILYLRFVRELTQSEIAQRIGVSQMQISRVLRRSLVRLHEFADGDGAATAGAAATTG